MRTLLKYLGLILIAIGVFLLVGYCYPSATTGVGYSIHTRLVIPPPVELTPIAIPEVPTWFTSPEPAKRG